MLKVYTLGSGIPITPGPPAAGDPFTFVVPGTYRWSILSVYAVLSRAAGGTGTRQPTLTITDGTHTVTAGGFTDNATDPGTYGITWTTVNNAAQTSDADGFALVPFPTLTLPPGYNLIGTSVNDPGGDQWTEAQVWVDETLQT